MSKSRTTKKEKISVASEVMSCHMSCTKTCIATIILYVCISPNICFHIEIMLFFALFRLTALKSGNHAVKTTWKGQSSDREKNNSRTVKGGYDNMMINIAVLQTYAA